MPKYTQGFILAGGIFLPFTPVHFSVLEAQPLAPSLVLTAMTLQQYYYLWIGKFGWHYMITDRQI